MQIIFLSGTKCLRLPQNVNRFLVWHKKFGPAKNLLGPVKGQGIRCTVRQPNNVDNSFHGCLKQGDLKLMIEC